MPTFMLFKGSEKVGSVVGADPNKLKVRPPASLVPPLPFLTPFRTQAALQHHSETSA